MTFGKPILVTGSHRSGSTWVGTTLGKSSSVGYIHEPFNLEHRLGICGAKFDYWFPYITEDNEEIVCEEIQKTLDFKYNIIGELEIINSLKDVGRLFRDYGIFVKYRLLKVRPLIKDPIAIFSTEWLASKFNMDVVVLIRHPAAFVSSIKVKQWSFPFSHLLAQPLLIRDYLYPFKEEIEEYTIQEKDVIEQAILLWKIIHYVIIEYQKNHKNWIFIRHEDISRDPVLEFKALFQKLNIKFSESVSDFIKEYSCVDNDNNVFSINKQLPFRKKFELKRDSKENIYNWKNRLTGSEVSRIRSQVESISNTFYSDSDW